MKELQNFIYKHMDSLKNHKRYVAMLTALSLLVSFVVPLILIEPADSMTGVLVCKKTVHTHNTECYVGNILNCSIEEHIHTSECYKKLSLLSLKGSSSNGTINEDNVAVPNAGGGLVDGSYTSADAHPVDTAESAFYNPATLPLYTLLFGEGENHWVDPSKSLEDNLEIVDDKYFLGFASDFCAFIESDFTATDADAEGRIFIGGDLTFKNDWNYQVGAGDYGQFTPMLQTDEYGDLTGFASGIIGGKVYRLATMTTGAYKSLSYDTSGINDRHIDEKENDVFLYPDEGAYKRFIVGNLKDSLHYDEDGTDTLDIEYSSSCNHLYYKHKCTICGNTAETMAAEHSYLGDVNELSQFYLYDNVSTILEKTFDTLRARSLSLASVQAIEGKIENSTLELDASDIGDVKTVYFKINDWKDFDKVVIIVPDDRITYTESGDIEEKYANNNKTIKNLDLNIIVSCDKELIEITQNTATYIRAKSDNTEEKLKDLDDKLGYKISNRNANATNNHPVSSNILYNFYNATKVEFTGDTNFNGTIYAPNASVIAPEKCRGHLSGALIAKSFEGGLEFGYRPYRGGVDIFGMASGYAIPVDKVDQDGAILPGALFAIKENAKFVSLFESGNGTNFAVLPSRVDFTGQTAYEQDEVSQELNAKREYSGNTVIGEKLTAPVELTLYKDQGCNEPIEDGATLDNVLTKFYLKANQSVVLDNNDNIYTEYDSNSGVYTIHLIKPVESLTITAKNAADSTSEDTATVNLTPKMVLNVTSTEFAVGTPITLEVNNPPTGDTIYYKYFVNGSAINNDYYEQNSSYTYTPTGAGDYIFSVKSYVKVGENYYEVEAVTADKLAIKDFEFSENLAISIPDSITSGDTLTIGVTGAEGATLTYAFYNSNYQSGNTFDTSGIVGKDLPVKVTVTANGKSVELYDTITVNFKDDISFSSYETTYVVDSNNYFNFNLQNADQYQNKTITYYFNNTKLDGNSVDKTLVGDNIPVYAVISANGLEKTIYGTSVIGKYNDQLGMNISNGPYTAGNSIDLSVNYAPNGAKVVFKAYDSNNNVVWTSEEQTVNNGEALAAFTPDNSGNYTFKAFMTFAENPVKELSGSTISVAVKPVNGELSVTPNQANTGNDIELKVHDATIGANVVFTVRDQYWNAVKTFNGTVNDNGECIITYRPDQAGNYTVYAVISKDGAERQVQQSLTINENTTALSGDFSVTLSATTPGSSVAVNVNSANNSAVVNVYVTYPSGYTQPQSGNISNGTYNWSFNANDAGSYSIKVSIVQNGTTLELGEQKFTISSGNDVSGDISVSPEAVTPYDPINVNITNAPVGASVSFKFYYYGNLFNSSKSATVGADGSCSVTFEPSIVGNYQVEAINNNESVKTVETSFKSNATFELDKSEDVAGEYIIRVSEIHDAGGNTQTFNVQEFTINGQTVSSYTVNGNTITFDTSEQDYGGTYNLYLRIQLSGGAVTEFSTEIINNASTESTSFTLKNVNIQSDESIDPDNLIEIAASTGESIGSVKLTFPGDVDAKQAEFTLEATFTDSNGGTHTKQYNKDNVADQNPDYLDISTSEFGVDIKTIEIKSIAGSIMVDKCYPTFVKTENKITQKYAQGFTLKQNEEKEIVLVDWVNPEDSVQTLDSITFDIIIEEGNSNKIYYALIREGETVPVFIEAPAPNDENKIVITGLNAENIEKIKVYTTDESLTINDYTISAFVGSSNYSQDELNALRTQTQDITSVYTLVEQQASVGYFKEETVYIIEVKESIKFYETAGDSPYPRDVETTVTVKKTDGTEVLSYTVDIDYSSNNGTNTKTITHSDGTVFTLTENTENETLTVTCTNGGVDTSNWDKTTPKQYGNYYFDPVAMMVVPVPAAHPIFTNEIGLLFRKVDDKGAAVKGVEISLVPELGVDDADLWYWDKNSREHLIDYKKLSMETVYKFTETNAGGKYDLAEDIYFQRTADKEITYWLGSETKPAERTDENQLTVLDLTKERIIRMENTRIPGIKLQLKKTDIETGSKIEGDEENNNYAVFALYANDGTELSNPINVVNGLVELDLSNYNNEDTTYVENGYLKPGTYYLKEIKAPSGYEASTRLFYFNVVKDSDGAYSATSSEIMPGVTEMKETQSDGKVHTITTFKQDALKIISDGIAAGTINADTPIIQFKFETDSGEMGWGNAKFKAKVNDVEVSPNTSKYPSGCDTHENGMSFQAETVTVQFTVQQLCELFDVEVENFNTINEFVIDTCNSTIVEELDFWVIENSITDDSDSGDSGDSGSGESTMTGGVTIKDIVWNTENIPYTIDKLIFYYADGSSKSNNGTINADNGSYWHKFDLSGYSLTNVVAIQMQVSGDEITENGHKKFMIEANEGKIWGQSEESTEYTYIDPGILYTFGTIPEAKVTTTVATTTTTTTTTAESTTAGSTTTTTTVAIPMLSISNGNIIEIPNAPLGTTMDLRVDKKWVGDKGIEQFRKPVEVELKRKAGENGTYTTFKPTGQENDYITLNSSNDWSYIWEDLPRYVDESNLEGDKYYYSVVKKTTVPGYTPSIAGSDINEGGTITITNTLTTVEIPVTKTWNAESQYGDIDNLVPDKLKVKLQASENGTDWEDVPGRTIELTKSENKQEGDTTTNQVWAGKFENLPKGYQYKVVELDVPFGWTVSYDNDKTNTTDNIEAFNITNTYELVTGSIAIQKLWENLGENAALPYSIVVDLYRSVIKPSYTETDAPYTDKDESGSLVDGKYKYMTDYARLLQHSLYFYDANMCGTDVAENSAIAWRTNCHVEDEVPGGYHDAGDHVMFGLPQGYTASMLGWSYLEFIKESSTYTVNQGEKDHYKLILERFYDFFVNSVKYDANGNISELLVQKGLGSVDHDIWCAPEKQVSRADEMVWTSTSGSNVAAEYAAALALGYLNFKDDDPTKYNNYLEVAEKLYEFAGRTSAFVASDTSGEYYADGESDDDRAWAAAWLYEATELRDGEENASYKDARSSEAGELQWDSVKLAAACAMARQTNDWSNVTNYIDQNYVNKDYYYIHSWGTARFNAMAQTATLIAAKYNSDKKGDYVNWAVGQMNKLLGDNEWKDTINGVCNGGTITDTNSAICLVTNFVPDGFDVDTPQAAHHRAASGWDTHEKYKENCGYDDDSYALIGALAGGPAFGAHTNQSQMNNFNHNHPTSDHTYIDDLHDYCCNEVAIDYNAGLVGAAAGLYYFEGKGSPSTKIEGVEYGAYGLPTPTATANGIESPTNSAVPEATEADSLSEEALAVLTAFSIKQTNAVSINEDSTSGNCYTLEAHTFSSSETGDQNAGYTYSGNYQNVTEIQVDLSYSGNFGMQLTVKSGDTTVVDSGWMQNNDSNWPNPSTYLSSIKFENPTTITSLQFWNVQPWSGGEFKITAIRLYYEAGTTFSLTPEKTTIAFNEKIQLTPSGNGTIADVSSWTVEPTGAATITKEGDNWYLTAGNTAQDNVTVTATDADGKTGTATINIKDMEITGADSVGIESEITLDKQYAPPNTTKYIWSSSDESKAIVDQNGKVTGVAAGNVTITLKAYDDSDTLLATATKDINVVNIRTVTYTDNLGTLDNGNKKFFKLSDYLPTGAILKSVSINVSPKDGGTISGFQGGLMVGTEGSSIWNQENFNVTLNPEGQTFTLGESYMTNIDCSIHDFCFGLWGSACTVNINSLTFEYEMDSTYIEIKYPDGSDSKTIRKGESVSFRVTPTGGTIGSVQLKNGDTVVETYDNTGSYTITPTDAGDYTIVAAMSEDASKTASISLTVQDNITINGNAIMDLGSSQTLTVNNAIGNITWNVTAGENYTVEGDEVVTIKKDNETVATFNKSTGVVEVFNSGGEFTITAADSYDNGVEDKVASITISISERPKVPELPKDVFLEKVDVVTLTNDDKISDNIWEKTIGELPMYDSKGNPYYYYIQESGYTRTENGEYNAMTDEVGHYIYSSNAVFMPINYYDNGIAPVKSGDVPTAKVGNKLTKTIQGELPSTGGSGVKTYYYFGGAIMLLGIAGFTGLKRRERKRREE